MLAVAQYISFYAPDGQPLTPAGVRDYQNFFIGETRSWGGVTYLYAPFVIGGDISTEGSQNGDAELLAPANLLTGAVLWEAAQNRFLLDIKTVMLNGAVPGSPDGAVTWTEQVTVASEVWCCDGMSYSDDVPGETDALATVILRLTSPLNAVTGQAPTRRLRDDQVGALPASGGISF